MACTQTMPAQAFTLFPQLPLELRRKVWSAALPEARTVTLQPYVTQTADGLPTTQIKNTRLPTPTVFHVSRESRTEAFMAYKPCFHGFEEGLLKKSTYIDAASDTLYCDFHMPMSTPQMTRAMDERKRSLTPADAPMLSSLETLAAQEGHHIRRLAVHFGSPFSPFFRVDVTTPMRACAAPLLQMQRLDEVTLVWMETASPRNHFARHMPAGSAPGRQCAIDEEMDWDKDYLDDIESERKALQKVLDDAERERPGWKAPVVKVLVDQ